LDQVLPVLPVDEVSPGSTWARASDLTSAVGHGVVPYTARGRFLRYDDLDGIRVAVVRTAAAAPVSLTVDLGRPLPASPRSASGAPAGVQPAIAYRGDLAIHQLSWVDGSAGAILRTRADGTFHLTLSPRGFPTVLYSFDGVTPSQGTGGWLPFGGGPPGQDVRQGSDAGDVIVLDGTFALRLHRLASAPR
jgi:hypothetical protein